MKNTAMSAILNFFKIILVSSLQIIIPILVCSLVLISIPYYPFESLISKVILFVSNQTIVFIIIFFKIFLIISLVSSFLFFIFFNFSSKIKVSCIFIFFFLTILRMIVIYSNVADNWVLFHKYSSLSNFIQFSFQTRFSKSLLDWSPFIFVSIALVINIMSYAPKIFKKGYLKEKKLDFNSEVLEQESQKYSKQAILIFCSLIFGGTFLFFLNPKLRLELVKNQSSNQKPNVFLFIIDSARFDRIDDNQYESLMPFLHAQKQKAQIYSSILSSHTSAMKSFYEILSGNFYFDQISQKDLFTAKSNQQFPLIDELKKNGYSSIFVSDRLEAKNNFEKKAISALPPLLSFLILPNVQRTFSGFIEIPIPQDPFLLTRSFENVLLQNRNTKKPLFITTFFSFNTIEDSDLTHSVNAYNTYLNSIDKTLEKLFLELKAKKWTNHAIILVTGTHGKSFQEFKNPSLFLSSGNEENFLTGLMIFSDIPKYFTLGKDDRMVRTVDIAPTILDMISLRSEKIFDGKSLLSKDSRDLKTNANFQYWENSKSLLKDRAWITKDYKLILESTHNDVIPHLFSRQDIFSAHDYLLLKPSRYQKIANRLISEVNAFLNKRNTEIIYNQDGKFFYSESIEK